MTTYTNEYPPAHSDTYVKSTTYYATYFLPYFCTDPAKSLTGSSLYNAYVSDGTTQNRFHIDLGTAKIIRRLYYENYHNSGSETTRGAKDFTLWGSNVASAFADLVYGHDTDWTSLTIAASTFDQHSSSDAADPKNILVTNTVAYRYYCAKISTNYGGGYTGLRRFVLQTEDGYGLTTFVPKIISVF